MLTIILAVWFLLAVLAFWLRPVAITFGAWEHEPFGPQPGRAGRSAPAAGARGATRPTIINDLARTGALKVPPQPKH